jgi:hypothetical protein
MYCSCANTGRLREGGLSQGLQSMCVCVYTVAAGLYLRGGAV